MSHQTTHTRATLSPVLMLNTHFLPSSHDWASGADEGRNPYRVDTYLRQARAAAEAGIDILFQAYFSGVDRARVGAGPWSPPFEPFQLSAVTAAAVEGITVMPTISTLHTHPISAARSLASLDRISNGRAALNLVSSFRSGTAIGVKRKVDRSRRHVQTEEFLTVLHALWKSWPPDALVPDASRGRYVRDELIRDVGHAGEFYEQEGPIDLPPHSQAFPPLMMAAGSLAGLRLAVQSSTYVFAAASTLTAAKRLRRVMRAEAASAGRDPDAVYLILGANLLTGPRVAPSRIRLPDAALIQLRRSLAQDIPSLGLETVSLDDALPALFSADGEETLRAFGARASGLWELAARPSQTVRDFLAAAAMQGELANFYGRVEDVAAEMRQWIEDGSVDGFQFIRGNDFAALCETIIPALRRARRKNDGRP